MSLAHWKQYESENLQVDFYFYQETQQQHIPVIIILQSTQKTMSGLHNSIAPFTIIFIDSQDEFEINKMAFPLFQINAVFFVVRHNLRFQGHHYVSFVSFIPLFLSGQDNFLNCFSSYLHTQLDGTIHLKENDHKFLDKS